MRDPLSESRLKVLHPKAKDIFRAFIEDAENGLNTTIRIVQGLRTPEQQAEIWAQGRTKAGRIVTNARPYFSFHNYGLAIDTVEVKDGKMNWNFIYEQLLPYSEKYNLKWGGHFKSIIDKPHFEISFGLTIKQLYEKVQKKDYIEGTKYVNI